jgi:hypothetical protein
MMRKQIFGLLLHKGNIDMSFAETSNCFTAAGEVCAMTNCWDVLSELIFIVLFVNCYDLVLLILI